MLRPCIIICSVQPTYPFWGGSEKFWHEAVLDTRVREQFECCVMLSRSPATRPIGAHLRSLGVHVGSNPVIEGEVTVPGILGRAGRRLKRFVRPDRARRSWTEAIARYHPALIWFNLADLSGADFIGDAVAVCQSQGVPYWLVVQHAFEHVFAHTDAAVDSLASVFTGARRVVCISERNKLTLERALGRRLENVWMTTNSLTGEFMERASEVAAVHPVRAEGTARLLNLARFDPKFKGQHILLETLSDARWLTRDWNLVLQGWGELSQLLERLIGYYGVPNDRLQLREFTGDVLPTIAESDLLVMPSLSEGTPFALVEAMACARPAVATPVGGMPELVDEGKTGWLARSTEVADFSDALERAWAARSSWSVCGENARSRVSVSYNRKHTMYDLIESIKQDVREQSNL